MREFSQRKLFIKLSNLSYMENSELYSRLRERVRFTICGENLKEIQVYNLFWAAATLGQVFKLILISLEPFNKHMVCTCKAGRGLLLVG